MNGPDGDTVRRPPLSWLPRAQHVWVTNMGAAGDRHAGLLLAWRRSDRPGPTRWEGWVIFVKSGVGARGDGPYVTQSWVEATGIEQLG